MTSLEHTITSELEAACRRLQLTPGRIVLEICREFEFGDLTTSLALNLSRAAGYPARELAQTLVANFPTSEAGVAAVDVAGPGFLNFRAGPGYLRETVRRIVSTPGRLGDDAEGAGAKWLFEFVSANPTGPLNVVSARAASVGDTLVRVMRKRGWNARAEYYVNDGGGQVRNLGGSLRARIAQLRGDAEAAVPEGGYHGAYVIDLARTYLAENAAEALPDDLSLGKWAADRIRDEQEKSLTTFRVTFDRWFRESELFADGRVDQAYTKLYEGGFTYPKDGAVWFRASEYGDSADRVLKTSDGRFTYVVPDIAYHLDKLARGNVRAVTILGPDHHGHVAQLRAALKALGVPPNFLVPLLIQQVNLKRGGEEVKMSKRAGVGVTLDELVEEVGVDAARFFFLMRKTTSHLDFDLELAKRHSEDNPVYYVQYAHARIRSIFRQPDAFEPAPDTDLGCLNQPEEITLMRTLIRFPWTLAAVARSLEPHPLTIYLSDLARAFHAFYQRHRVIGPDRALSSARLLLCRAVQAVLQEGLECIGVSAPDRM